MTDLQVWAVGIGATVAVGAFARFMPKAKLISWAQTVCGGAGKAFSKILLLRLGKKAAESIEEGVFATIAATVYAGIDAFMKGLLYDNEGRNTNA